MATGPGRPAAPPVGGRAPWIGLLVGSQRRMATLSELASVVDREVGVAEDGGVSVFVAPEHIESEPYAMLRSFPLAAALATRLDGRSTVVASVIAGLSHPATTGQDVVTVAAFAQCQVGLAVLAGYRRSEFERCGADFEERFAQRWTMLEHMKAAASIPEGWLWCAVSGERTAARSAAVGAVSYGGPSLPTDEVAALARAGGRIVLRRDVITGPSSDAVADRLRRFVDPKYAAYGSWGYAPEGPRHVVAGRGEEVATELDNLVGLVGTDGLAGVVLRVCWPDMTGDDGVEQVRMVVDDVLPRLERYEWAGARA